MSIIKKRDYNSYGDYLKHQSEKTSSNKLRGKLSKKMIRKIDAFKTRFSNLKNIGLNNKRALCLGARLGEEVVALIQLGFDAIGIDLVPFPPHVIKGDFNNLPYIKEFDIVYSNSFDHTWDYKMFFENVNKVLKLNGLFVLDFFSSQQMFGRYEVMFIENYKDIIDECSKYGFKLRKTEDIKPRLYRGKHKEVQFIFEKTNDS